VWLAESFEISQPLDFKFTVTKTDGTTEERRSGGKETRDRSRRIHIKLRSGDSRINYGHKDKTTFSMFGTKRVIEDIRLDILGEPES